MSISILGMNVIYPYVTLTVILIALLVSVLSTFLHRKITDRERMNEIREKIEEHQEKYFEAHEEGDEEEMEKLEKEQEKVMELLKENIKNSLKPMLVTTPVILGVIFVLRSTYSPLGPLVELPFGVPFITQNIPAAGIQNGIDWFMIYIMFAMTTGLGLELGLRKILGK